LNDLGGFQPLVGVIVRLTIDRLGRQVAPSAIRPHCSRHKHV